MQQKSLPSKSLADLDHMPQLDSQSAASYSWSQGLSKYSHSTSDVSATSGSVAWRDLVIYGFGRKREKQRERIAEGKADERQEGYVRGRMQSVSLCVILRSILTATIDSIAVSNGCSF